MNLRRRMSLSRSMLNRVARRNRLGCLAPFVHPILRSVPVMPKPAFSLVPQAGVVPEARLVTKPSIMAEVVEYQSVSAKIDQLTVRKKALGAKLLAHHQKYGKRYKTDEYAVTETRGCNTTIDKQILVEKGVRATIIKAATRETEYFYPRVTRLKSVE